ncbi:pirin family protein [Psychrosphaera aquimarina]|uniref:Pirin family protein n=1 Tax=Psychrosphaera aquimarina TaxID=2044854 RepID=A0ABU3QZH2_9GAMM|nr:pirin family protein [Psychrosphaera aquimarina]MDU0112550.1 pirin family protein [Psychrosphaera aquimarina]
MAILLKAKDHDLGGLTVKRVLPHQQKRMVGPFIFFDQMGPSHFDAGQGINVRPHPHIGLSTLTYLFEGSILHRDSLGNIAEIHPGDVNWMTSGKGIVHSERESFEVRANDHSISGLQCWIALPEEKAELDPSFIHVNKQQLPNYLYQGVMKRLVVGDAYGMNSPAKTYWPMFFLDVVAEKGETIQIPNPAQETAILPIYGEVSINGDNFSASEFVLLEQGEHEIEVTQNTRFIMLGGDKFEHVPFLFWNFVSFNKERIEQAKDDWNNGRFPTIPDDNKEYIPL